MLRVFNQHDVETSLNILDVINAVEKAYVLNAQKQVTQFPTVVHFFPEDEGDMDIKSGCIDSEGLLGMKMITYMEHNPSKGIEPLMGCLMLFDRVTGTPLALVHAASVTNLRTGAAAGIGAKYLARKDAETVLLVGCGVQAAACAAATLICCPSVKRVLCCCRSLDKAKTFAAGLPELFAKRYLATLPADHEGYAATKAAFEVEFVGVTAEEGAREADIILTVTPSRQSIIKREWLKEGVHLSCMGADMEGKQELDPQIVADAAVYCDDIAKTSKYGEMQTAIKQELFTANDIVAELGAVIAGTAKGRSDNAQLTIFDASGISPQDILSAAMLLGDPDKGQKVDF